MSQYYPKTDMVWTDAAVRGGTVMNKSIVWEGKYGLRSAFFRMPKGMTIPKHTHPDWVQVMVVEGEIEIDSEPDNKHSVAAGGCYFVEPGDTHIEIAVIDSLVLVTQAEDRPEFLSADNS